ncbi:MAG: hypothetical protein H6853_03680 [Rhodospirillales bacterium]|nr:hypothetical protein [Alphaproteobacteria bacterium]USO04382.1 MAG: hypothetical protein H6853_03680 [Rhodospirillales bacterium]
MRKILQGFLVIIMLTPVLTCAMSVCPVQAAKAATVEKPCHESAKSTQKKAAKGGPMLVLDCMGVDLFSADDTIDLQPDRQIDTLHFVWADLVAESEFFPAHSNAIRGPPEWKRISQAHLPIILTTQRFRN